MSPYKLESLKLNYSGLTLDTMIWLDDAYESYQNNDKDKAKELIKKALYEGDSNATNAWWLTETGEYGLVSKEYLDFCKKYYFDELCADLIMRSFKKK